MNDHELLGESERRRPLAIVGPTASGKSSLAMALAARGSGEIVSCDSVQVFREFEIGCAKPTPAERQQIRHHLVDVADWDEDFDARRYRDLAVRAIRDILARGKTPIICGGTGLYLRVLRYGLVDAPGAHPALRAQLEAEEAAQPGTLYERLRCLDPVTAKQTPPTNRVRIIRALEIQTITGQPASALRAQHGFGRELVPMRVVAVQRSTTDLRQRIKKRTQAMLHAGLFEEVQHLLERGVQADCRAMRSVGYRETCAVVLGNQPCEGLAERIAQSTWAYARRQRTWLRREPDVADWPADTDLDTTVQWLRQLGFDLD